MTATPGRSTRWSRGPEATARWSRWLPTSSCVRLQATTSACLFLSSCSCADSVLCVRVDQQRSLRARARAAQGPADVGVPAIQLGPARRARRYCAPDRELGLMAAGWTTAVYDCCVCVNGCENQAIHLHYCALACYGQQSTAAARCHEQPEDAAQEACECRAAQSAARSSLTVAAHEKHGSR